jgi:hypothetical protein
VLLLNNNTLLQDRDLGNQKSSASGQAAAPPRRVMNSRRRMGSIPGWAIRSTEEY